MRERRFSRLNSIPPTEKNLTGKISIVQHQKPKRFENPGVARRDAVSTGTRPNGTPSCSDKTSTTRYTRINSTAVNYLINCRTMRQAYGIECSLPEIVKCHSSRVKVGRTCKLAEYKWPTRHRSHMTAFASDDELFVADTSSF